MTEAARRYGFGALAHRNFRLFFIGQGISLVGTWMQNVGEGWLILTLTNSPFYVGLTAALSSLGVLLFSLYAGVVADRVDKRRVIIFMQLAFMIEAFTVAILVWTGVIAVWQVLVLATVLGIASAFDIPMRQSFIVEMVGKDDLMNAIALNSSLFNGARVLGPAIAGFLIGALGIAWCYFLNGLSYIAVIAGLLLMRLSAWRVLALSMVLLALAGCAMIVNNSITNTLLQTAAPDHLRGRIMGFYSFVFVGMAPFGAFLFGLVAEHVGVPHTLAAGGAIVALAVVITAIRVPELRQA